jgi:hypothetical protein
MVFLLNPNLVTLVTANVDFDNHSNKDMTHFLNILFCDKVEH